MCEEINVNLLLWVGILPPLPASEARQERLSVFLIQPFFSNPGSPLYPVTLVVPPAPRETWPPQLALLKAGFRSGQ